MKSRLGNLMGDEVDHSKTMSLHTDEYRIPASENELPTRNGRKSSDRLCPSLLRHWYWMRNRYLVMPRRVPDTNSVEDETNKVLLLATLLDMFGQVKLPGQRVSANGCA
jgi:hypothetical protein